MRAEGAPRYPRPVSLPPAPPSPRLAPVLAALILYVTMGSALRAALLAWFGRHEPAGALEAAQVLLIGLRLDATFGLASILPAALALLALPRRALAGRAVRAFVHAAFLLGATLLPFLLVVEWFFFDEFDARFNTVAVDYLLFPHEVAGNIRDSYPVGRVLLACALAGAASWALLRPLLARAFTPAVRESRLRDAIVLTGVAVIAVASVSRRTTDRLRTRVLSELADNGVHAFSVALLTRDLDYAAYYPVLPRDEAWARVRRLAGGGARFAERHSLERHVEGDASRARLNVVIVLEESLGSEFWGSLGRPGPSCTPRMDALAAHGTLFTRVHATGSRTVRGMEGVLASFPPLPGDAIVRRPHSDHVETIARLLRRDGYETLFAYGGRGLFDGMRSFTTRNGWSRFVEQKDFDQPAHVTAWGVSDEDLFDRCLDEMDGLRGSGPFLLTALTVSNHKPFTFPAGRVDPPPGFRRRERAVMYADWALARFLEQARDRGYWDDTIFAIVADHGARVYGSQDIPMTSYEIPLLLFGPEGVVERGARVDVAGSSLDVSPTILGRIGRPYDTVFFGRDLLGAGAAASPGVIPLHHDRDIGLLSGDRLAVLTLGRTSEVYAIDAAGRQAQEPERSPSAKDLDLVRDATAIFQVADEVYLAGRYRLARDAP